MIGLFGLDRPLHEFSAASQQWDSQSTNTFFMSYPGGRYLTNQKMTTYINSIRGSKKIVRLSSEQFLLAALSSPFALELMNCGRGLSWDPNATVAQWCTERLLAARCHIQDHSCDPFANDMVIQDLCCLLQILSWSKHSSRDCMHIALCEHTTNQVIHCISKMASISSCDSQIQMLGDILESEMSVLVRRGHSRTLWRLAGLKNKPAESLDSLRKHVRTLLSNYGSYLGESSSEE